MSAAPSPVPVPVARLCRFHYAWVIVATTFGVMLMAAGVRSMSGILILPLEQEFGWSRAILSLAISINLLLFGLGGPFAAAIVERVGMGRMMAGVLLTISAAAGLTTLMNASWQLVALWGLVIGTALGGLSGWMAATVANRWFAERRGLVVGWLSIANSMGQLLFLPGLAALAAEFGWRPMVLLVAGLTLLAIPPVLILVRDHPQDVGLRPYGAGADWRPSPASYGAGGNPVTEALRTLARGLRDRNFLILSGSFFVCGASANGLIGTHLIPASVEHGMSEVIAADMLAAMGLFSMAGALLSGWLSDRMDCRKLLAWYYGLRGLSLLFLPYAYDAGLFPLAIFVVFYGLDWSATGPPTIRLSADLFGRHRAGAVYAWILTAHQLGAATIALGAGALHTWLGSYHVSFLLSGVLCQVAVVLVLRIGRPATARSFDR